MKSQRSKYISRLSLDDEKNLIINYSDGTQLDAGYLPTHGISIWYKEEIEDGEYKH